ncbi:NPCBM/NEW2 domain-containing protein [Burkholderiaceae bacterium DAT-1]|nr:NPCBM/NEW2 domain-containing protein [Burkholderiaceae bacterium DAT-1]
MSPRSRVRFRHSFISTATLLALTHLPAQALTAGNVKTLRAEASTQSVDIRTDNGMHVQINLLRPDMFRIQAGTGDQFTGAGDKAAPIVIKQYGDKINHTLSTEGDYQLLRTDAMALRIYSKPLRFALYKADNATLIWQEVQPLQVSKRESVQTLDSNTAEHFFGGGQQNGQFEFKGKSLEVSYSGGWEEGDRPSPAPFYFSTRGYGVLRNTWANGSYDFRAQEFLTAGHQEERFDAYYFVGDTPAKLLSAFTDLTGRAGKLPRWGYEYGDADCYNDGDNVKKPGTVPTGWSDGPTGTTPDVIKSVAAKYREHDMPGGWILPNDGYGCGYTDLPKVVKGLQDYGFKTGLWTENGVDKIAWEVGQAGTRAQKLDVAWTGKGYQFALDANQAAADGILKNSDSRPFVWTVMGWAGIQRYAITWTGDQTGSWDYIRWHIPTLIGSGLSGQVYATGDVDGIFGGSPETFMRDLQWKAFTPVLMGMSGWSNAERKHPWWFDEPYRSINREILKHRMRLMPYIYTYAHDAEQTGAPIVRGLMWDHPNDPHAHTEDYKYQFFLGRDFLVAPVYRSQATSGGWRRGVYLPEGEWIDYNDGRVVEADKHGKLLDYAVKLDTLPVFVRAGAIIPMYPTALFDGQVPKDTVTWDIYPKGNSAFTLYEDDGNTRAYQSGKFSQQRVSVFTDSAAGIRVEVGAIAGSYDGQEAERRTILQIHTRTAPRQVQLGDTALRALASRAELDQADSGWFFDATDKYGILTIKTSRASIRQSTSFLIQQDTQAVVTPTAGYPAAPDLGRTVPSDSIRVVNRPAEEPGYPLENALDEKPDTWFRTIRDLAVKTGPHEFVLSLGERRMIDGIQITGRTDKHWRYGQPKDIELYLGDNNGDWGKPIYRGTVPLSDSLKTIEFAPHAGRLLRVRILSTHDEDAEGNNSDPMVLAAEASDAPPKAFNAFIPQDISSVIISTFKILEFQQPNQPKQQQYLSEAKWDKADNSARSVALNHPGTRKPSADSMRMNGLAFRKGLGVSGNSRIDYTLKGNWHLFRADIGVDDACRDAGGLQFQLWGDDRLLYDSGLIKAPAVVKPELDIRGIRQLSLRTLGAKGSKPAEVCGNWANAMVTGLSGDSIGTH